jgi:hypothetical protein
MINSNYYLEAAKQSDPEGKICYFCKKENDFADDCGFFYVLDSNYPESREIYPACEACFKIHNPYHISIYGCGDR